jgi:N-acetylneuraminate synthase/sialic acid synthase
MREIILDGKIINDDSPAYVIAEVGHNHGGDVDTAYQMIDAAAAAGADAVKFQRVDAKELFTKEAYEQPYNSENAYAPTYGKHREHLTLPDDDFERLFAYCRKKGVTFMCTAFEEKSADFLNDMGCPVFKLASFHLLDWPLIDKIKSFNKPFILSTGHATMEDIWETAHYIGEANHALLQCTSEYPVRKPSHINLGNIRQMRKVFPDTVIGYSHHYEGPYPAAASYHYGARIVEVHFTLSRSAKGTDNAFSQTPEGLAWLIRQLALEREIAGSSKDIYEEERAPISKMARGVYARGQDFIFKAPRIGPSPRDYMRSIK